MKIVINRVTTPEDTAAVLSIRREVFENEMGITVDPLPFVDGHVTYFLARCGPDRVPVGCLCVVDTTNNRKLHVELGLNFDRQARVARFTHLAVLKSFRGMNIPLAMMLEAYRSVIGPREFDYTWLLFDVERAADSFLARELGFTLLPQTFVSQYGCRCPLVRDERALESARFIRQAQLAVDQSAVSYTSATVPSVISI